MALNKVNIPIKLGGLDTKTEEKNVIIGELLNLENGVFDKIGSIRKRNGFQQSNLTNIKTLGSYKNQLLAITDDGYNQTLYNQLKTTETWASKGAMGFVDLEVSEILRNNTEQKQANIGLNEQNRFYAWIDSRDQLRVSVYDIDNYSSLTTDLLIASGSNVQKPHFANVKGVILLFYVNQSGDGVCRKWNGSNFESEQIIYTGSPGASTLTVCDLKNPNGLSMGAFVLSGVYGYFVDENGTMTQSNMVGDDSTVVGSMGVHAISATQNNDTGKVYIAYSATNTFGGTTTNRVYMSAVNVSPTGVQNNSGNVYPIESFVLAFPTDPHCVNITTYNIRSTRDVKVLYEVSAASVKNHYIKISNHLSTGAISGSPSVYLRGVGLASQAFILNQDKDFGRVYVVNQTTLQSTYFLVKSTLQSGDGNAFIMGKCLYGQAVGLKTDGFLPRPIFLNSAKYIVAMDLNTKLVFENGSEFTLKGICQIQADFDYVPQIKEFADVAFINGGMQYVYDGSNIVESGFNLFPEDVLAVSGGTTGGLLEDGKYLYSVVWTWTDNIGNTHRSVPSIPKSITLAGGTTTQKVNLTIPTLKITNKTAPRAEVIAEVYRTEKNGTIFYRVSSASDPLYNDITANTLSFEDLKGDGDILANQLLYTTGDVLENVAPPQGTLTFLGKNRIFVLSGDDPYLLWASKPYEKYTHPGFNEVLQVRIPSDGGKIITGIEMDEKMVIFKKDKIYFFNGDGPNNVGYNQFGTVETISDSLGCINKKAIFLTPQGIIFATSKGIWLLDRGLNLSYIGAKVEKFNNEVVQTIEFVENKNQVRILTSSRALVYDTLVGLWAVFTIAGKSATIVDGTYHYVNNLGRHQKELENYYFDEGGAYSLTIETGWISFSGLQNYMRVFKMALLGSYYSSHNLNIKMFYNYLPIEADESNFNTALAINESIYGLGSDPYGDDENYGGNELDTTYQFRKHMKIQQCQSIKFIITDIRNADTIPQSNNKGFSINEIMLEIGIKNGQMRLKNNRTIV